MEINNQFLILLACYSLLFLLSLWVWKMKSDILISPKVQKGNWVLLHMRHAGGIIIMVVLPLLFLKNVPREILNWPQHVNNIQVIALMISGLVLFILSTKEADHVHDYHPIVNIRTTLHAILHMILRITFLVSYEWFFRGCLLVIAVTLFGIVPAIFINIALYALIHLMNGKKEFFGSFPLGLMLCVFTLWWKNIWPAALLHLLLSSSYESVLLHPFFCKPSKLIL